MATIADKASIVSAFTEFYAKIKPLISQAKTDAVSEVNAKGYQTADEVKTAINEALSAYGDGDKGAF